MQALRGAAGGTRASSAGGKSAAMHQQAGGALSAARGAAMAQPFGLPHKGQRAGSGVASAASFMRVVF